MIREALGTDIPRIVELGSRSLVDGPYKDLLKDTPEQSAKLALEVLEHKGKVLLYENDEGKVVGLLAFIIFPHYFTGELTAGELKLRLGRTAEAVGEFETLLGQLKPDSWLFRDVRLRIESTFLRTDDYDGLTKYYNAWLAKHP